MSDWTKLFSKEVYVKVTTDISLSVQRYFAPIVGLVHGVTETIGMTDTKHKDSGRDDDRLRLG